MSSPPPSVGPSALPDGPGTGALAGGGSSLAWLARSRGGPLIDALEEHLPGALDHANGSGAYAFACAIELGCDRERAELTREVARLHDIGLIYVPRELAEGDRDALADDERAELDAHHEAGFRLARGAGVPDRVCEAILKARERFDGAGPEGTGGDAIPLEARIARAACACHLALSAKPSEERSGDRRVAAIADLRARAGGELDPRIVDALVPVLERVAAPGT